ncbi:ferredoxin [Jatrophihabitans telluris]|uniref:Ferredoxin n=1 Tax=Jatrophihabitans telluris TaxID=2038343 RepID=A0ABY4QWG3_9ACTN|nr:ferredoxin [Jatrophihabitans telluris]UQX87381.1 ferredoxin [Jatrophihabitans telluris]
MTESPRRLRLDPVACDGVALCAHLAPRQITLDSWGFPIVHGELEHASDVRAARKAVNACPRQALFLETDPAGS